MKKLLLPRGYLSYSAKTMWEKNPKQFIAHYFEGKDKLDTKYLRFGKGMAEHWSQRDLQPGQITELETRINICGVPVLSFIDYYDSNNHVFEEDKTGKIPWTNSKVQKHEQLPFYATVLKHRYGTMPKSCTLVWLETIEGCADDSDFWAKAEKKLTLTGKEVRFVREFDEREITRMELSIIQTATQISDAYKAFIRDI